MRQHKFKENAKAIKERTEVNIEELKRLKTHLIEVNVWGSGHLSQSTLVGVCAGIKRVKKEIWRQTAIAEIKAEKEKGQKWK